MSRRVPRGGRAATGSREEACPMENLDAAWWASLNLAGQTASKLGQPGRNRGAGGSCPGRSFGCARRCAQGEIGAAGGRDRVLDNSCLYMYSLARVNNHEPFVSPLFF